MSRRGKLIIIEGLDRTGKSTQVSRLTNNLQKAGHTVEAMRFPDRSTAIGQSIDSYLRGTSQTNDQAIHLLFSANRWEQSSSMIEKLERGITLIVDRYSFSGAVYSAAKQIPGMDLDWAWTMEIGLPEPDMVFYLNVSEEVQMKRTGFGEERYENQEMQRRVMQQFVELWMRYWGRFDCVDAERTVEALEERIAGVVEKVMAEEGRPLGRLKALKGS